MQEHEELHNLAPFSFNKQEKADFYERQMAELTAYHAQHCSSYAKILKVLGFLPQKKRSVEEYPFLPVQLFKNYDLLSITRSEVVKTMTSSGTTGQQVAKIYLDRITAEKQTKALVKICMDFLGKKRMPMLFIDTQNVIRDRHLFSARGAAMIGFSILGYDHTYALNQKMQVDLDVVESFLERHQGETILIFGFTSLVWESFYEPLVASNRKLSLEHGILLHGGGWKKLKDKAVSNAKYKEKLCQAFGLQRIFNYYGMVEQTGSIFMECEYGRLHASNYSDILIRRPRDFSLAEPGEKGLIELLSVLPTSYPGHILLTEDEGEILGEDDCPCGRLGKTFQIHGRIQNAEVRGCSDTYERRT